MKPVINYYMRVNGSKHIVEHFDTHESGDYILRQLFTDTDNGYRQHKWDFEQDYTVVDKSVVDALERQTCPDNTMSPNTDHWRTLDNGDKTCSFCGSLHPEDVLRIMKQHGFGAVERTTKGYKWYINQPGVRNAMEGGIKYYLWHNTDEFVEKYNDLNYKL